MEPLEVAKGLKENFAAQHIVMLSVLILGALPVLIAYLLMSRQFIRGLTAGAVKG